MYIHKTHIVRIVIVIVMMVYEISKIPPDISMENTVSIPHPIPPPRMLLSEIRCISAR